MTGFVQKDADRAEMAALVEKRVAERCAPLVKALETIADGHWRPVVSRQIAREALAAYHAAQGAGRET